MSKQPVLTGACCPGIVSGVTQLTMGDDGHSVGIVGLDTVFEQLLAQGRKPDEVLGAELLEMVRAARNYIPSRPDVEAKYVAALRLAYAAFYARRA